MTGNASPYSASGSSSAGLAPDMDPAPVRSAGDADRDVMVSVVRDDGMYARCISGNPHCSGFRLVSYDNRAENKAVSSRYNEFLSSLSPESDFWIIFCHEDWELLEDLHPDRLDKARIYGPVGVYLQPRRKCDYLIFKGEELQCDKSGGAVDRLRFPVRSGRVDTLDCQCVIVHSSLVLKYGLLFDENLSFDLYAEDFCAGASTAYGIITEVTPIKCMHHSLGTVSDAFRRSLDYLDVKYRSSVKRFASIVGYKTVFGGGKPRRAVHRTRFPRLSAFFGRVF